MSASVPAKLARLISTLAFALMLILFYIHRTSPHFHTTIGIGGGGHNNNNNNNNNNRDDYGDAPHENAPRGKYAHTKTMHARRKMRREEEAEEKGNNDEEENHGGGDNGNDDDNFEEPSGPMNIVLFYADDWRHDTLGAAGNPIVKTPVLDALASEGVRFTENCVTTSICWVSRATLYSGQYLARHHFEMLGRGRTVVLPDGTQVEMKFEVPQNETLYSLLKKKAKYVVGHAGKLGLWVELDRALNFDFFVDEDGWHWRKLGDRMWHITEKNTGDALRFLMTRRRKDPQGNDVPFFLNVAYFATHAVDGDKKQYLPQNSSMSMYENDTIPVPPDTYYHSSLPPFFGDYNEGRTRWRWRFDEPHKHQSMMKNYYRMATEVDTSVGIILKHLEQEGTLNNTLIIFTTDNGNFHAEHGLADKWYPHQESIRVPLIIKDPRMSPQFRGTLNDEFTLNIDLTTTILAAAGLDPLPSMMGRDMSVLYRNRGLEKKKEEAETQQQQHDVDAATAQFRRKASGVPAADDTRRYPEPASDGEGRYNSGSDETWRTEFFYEHPMHTNPSYIPASEALVRKDYKYFYWPNFEYEQLFDIRTDPGEMNDLYHSTDPVHQQKLREMRKRFGELKMLAYSNMSIIL